MLILQFEAEIARREYEQERQEMLQAEAEERDTIAKIAEIRRTGEELPDWALHFIACYGDV
ncbi:hypothetical protein CH282_16000 [Rhodococcus sp. 06-418-1B]|nr:hypothetical protein CH282_16000 [Rhodococcus sp. 06-418-1B]